MGRLRALADVPEHTQLSLSHSFIVFVIVIILLEGKALAQSEVWALGKSFFFIKDTAVNQLPFYPTTWCYHQHASPIRWNCGGDGIEAKMFTLHFITQSFWVFFPIANKLSTAFHWGRLPSVCSAINQDWCCFAVMLDLLPHDLWSSAGKTIMFLVTSLTGTLLSWADLQRAVVVPNFFTKELWRSVCSWEALMQQKIFGAFPRSVSRHNPISELCRNHI